MKITNITKLRNNTGVVHTCKNCGREIKHAFQVGTAVYGSECVVSLFGDKVVKELTARAKSFEKILTSTIEDYAKAHKYTNEEMFNHYMRNGSLN